MGQLERANLVEERFQLEYKIASSTDVVDNIRTPGWINKENPRAFGLRLTDLDTDFKAGKFGNKFENMVRVGRIVERLRDQLTQNQQALGNLNSQIQALAEETPAIAVPSGPIPYEPTSLTPKISTIERRDLNIRQELAAFLQSVKQSGLTIPASPPQITRVFNSLTASFIDWAQEKGYLVPAEERDNRHPRFDIEDITVMHYLIGQRRRGGIRPKDIREVRDIIKEEISKLEKEDGSKKSKNGSTVNNGK